MGAKKLFLIVTLLYSTFTCFLMNVLGIVLSYEEQYFQWKIVNVKEAQYQIFKAALLHLLLLIACVSYSLWRKTQKRARHGAYKPIDSSEISA